MTKQLTCLAVAFSASATCLNAATVYTENFETIANGDPTPAGDTAFSAFDWTGVLAGGTTSGIGTSSPGRINDSADLEGTYRAFVNGASENQWFVSDFGGTAQTITGVSFQHRDSTAQVNEGYRIGFKIGSDWYVQDDFIARSSTLTTANVDLSVTKFNLWSDASTGNTDGWTTDPTVGGGSLLTTLQASSVTGFGLMTVQTAVTDQYRFDDFKINAVPEPSSIALLGLGGLALILRRRK